MNEQLKVIISAEIDKFKQTVDNAKKKLTNFKQEVEKAKANVSDNFAKMGEKAKAGAKAMAVGITAAATALLALGASTTEYREAQAKLKTAFEDAGGSAAAAKETYNDLYRVLGDTGKATEAASHLSKLTTNEKELAQWTTICQGIYAEFGDSLPIEGLTEAANETAKVGTVTGSLADALNWAGISEDAFNEKLAACNDEAERERLIRETLNGLYSNSAAEYEKNNAQILAQRDAQAKLQATTAKLGEAVAPIITAFTSFANDALAIVTPYIQTLAEKYMPTLQAVLEKTTAALQTAFEWIVQHKELLAVIGGIIGGITVAIGLYNTVQAIKTALDITGTLTVGALTTALWANIAAMAAAIAPYLLVVAAIAAVIAIVVLCVKHWDKIKEATKNAFAKMREIVSNAVSAIVGFFERIINWVKENWQGLLLLIVNPFAGAFKLAYDNCENFRNKVNEIFSKIKNAISEKINAAKDAVGGAIEKIKNFFNFNWSLPKLKMPHVKISGEFSLVPPSVPKFSIDWYAQGGVFDKPTLFGYGGALGGLGEDGAEAVVPLERNLGWLDKLASMLNEKQGNKPIYLVVDKRVIGQVSADGINEITRATGIVPINVM